MPDDNAEYVGFWPRVGASIIDAIIVMVITSPVLVAIYGWGYFTDVDKPFIAGPADFLISWVLPAIGVILFWLYKQATPGKMAVSARVVDARTGNTLTVGQSISRYLAYFVAMLPLFLGIIWVAFDPRKQGWHDKLAGTVVIRPKHRGTEPVRFES
ncbi:MAG TPA: RDD family protein [Xanthomonadaceae bacterium]|nr:RDD family protein [Xanthomonadaceae bacterium]